MVRACLAIYWVMAEGNESSSFSLPQPLSLKQILCNIRGCGQMYLSKNCDKPGRRLERGRGNNVLCFLSQTLGFTFLTCLQPNENKLNVPVFHSTLLVFYYVSWNIRFDGKGLKTYKNGSRSCRTKLNQARWGSLAPEDLWHSGFWCMIFFWNPENFIAQEEHHRDIYQMWIFAFPEKMLQAPCEKYCLIWSSNNC